MLSLLFLWGFNMNLRGKTCQVSKSSRFPQIPAEVMKQILKCLAGLLIYPTNPY